MKLFAGLFGLLFAVATGMAKPFAPFPLLGRATSNATVTVNNHRVNGRQAFEYWRYELAAANSNALALVGITNIGVYQDPTSATNQPSDIVTTNLTIGKGVGKGVGQNY